MAGLVNAKADKRNPAHPELGCSTPIHTALHVCYFALQSLGECLAAQKIPGHVACLSYVAYLGIVSWLGWQIG